MPNFFSGDLASTTQGYLSNSGSNKPVEIRDGQGLKLSNQTGLQSVLFTVTGTSALSLSGSLSISGTLAMDLMRTNSISTKTNTNLLLSPIGSGVLVPRGKSLALGGSPTAGTVLDVVAQAGGTESFSRWGTSDCDDRMEFSNCSSTAGKLSACISATQNSLDECALSFVSRMAPLTDVSSDTCAMRFTASLLDDSPLSNCTLFQWTNARGPRQTVSIMEMVRSSSGCDLVMPNALDERVRISGSGSLSIAGDPAFDLLRVSSSQPGGSVLKFSVHDELVDFNFTPAHNFVVENAAGASPASRPGRLVWNTTQEVLMVDTGTVVKRVGPATIDQLDLTLTDSSTVTGGSTGAPPALTAFDQTVLITPTMLSTGTRISLCIDGSMSRETASTCRIVVALGSTVIYDDTCSAFSVTGGGLVDQPWSLEIDLTCRSGGTAGQLVSYGECMVPFERGDIPSQSQRTSKYDLKACKRSFTLDCTRAYDCSVSIQWGASSSSGDSAKMCTYDLAVAKKA